MDWTEKDEKLLDWLIERNNKQIDREQKQWLEEQLKDPRVPKKMKDEYAEMLKEYY